MIGGRHDRTCTALRSLRLSSDRGAAEACGLACERQADRKAVATRGAESADETTKEGATLAQLRMVHSATVGAYRPMFQPNRCEEWWSLDIVSDALAIELHISVLETVDD